MNSEGYSALLGLDGKSIESRLVALGLTEADRLTLRHAAPDDANVGAFLDVLYGRMRQHADLAAMLANPAQVDALKRQQRVYLHELFTAPVDHSYVERRLAIGLAHHRVRLSPQWYLATYAHFICDHLPSLTAAAQTPATATVQVQTLVRSVFFDASLAIDAYGDAEERQLHHQDPAGATTGPASRLAAGGAAASTPHVRTETRARIRLSADGSSDMRRYIGVSDDVLDTVRGLEPVITRHLPRVLDDFYDTLQRLPETASMFGDGQRQRLMQQVTSYWLELAHGTFDRTYAASRMRIGVIHEKLGLSVAWYLSGLARQIASLLQIIFEECRDPLVTVDALVRAVFFDLAFVIDAYMEARADSLMRTEGYANQLVAGLASAVAVVDRHNRLISANQTMAAMCVGDPAVLYLMPAAKALPLPEASTVINTVRRTGTAQHSVLAQHGSRHYRVTGMALSGGPAPHRGSAPIAIVIDDVTDVLRMGAELSEETDRCAQLADSAGAILWEIDTERWTVTTINRAVASVTGYRDVYFLGRPGAWPDTIVDADRLRFTAAAAALRDGEAADVSYRVRAADGRDVWLRSRLVIAHGAPRRLIGITVDVTPEHRAQSLRLEATAVIAGGVAHVVNNALTVIRGNVELHAREQGGFAQTPLLQHAIAASDRAQEMVGRLMAFARRQPLKMETLSLTTVCRDEEQTLRELAGGQNVLTLDLTDDLPGCRTDRAMLGTALQALVTNARNAIPNSGSITLMTRIVPVGDLTKDTPGVVDGVELEVLDNGVGMSDEVRSRAFEPFFTTRSLAESSGLGLSLVHGFVAQSGGTVTLDSAVGRGTSVRLRFPRA